MDTGAEPLRGRTVLVAEDSFLTAMALQRQLELLGCVVAGPFASASDAEEAVDSCDLAVLDIHLRGGNSYALASHLRAKGKPFLFLTGFTTPPDLPADLLDVSRLTKPFEPKSLILCLTRLVTSDDAESASGDGRSARVSEDGTS